MNRISRLAMAVPCRATVCGKFSLAIKIVINANIVTAWTPQNHGLLAGTLPRAFQGII